MSDVNEWVKEQTDRKCTHNFSTEDVSRIFPSKTSLPTSYLFWWILIITYLSEFEKNYWIFSSFCPGLNTYNCKIA